MKIVNALVVLGLVASGRAFAAEERSQTTTSTTTTTTDRKANGDGGKTTTIETKTKSDGASGEATRDETLTVDKQVKSGNTGMKKHVKTSDKSRASRRTRRTDVEEDTVRDAQGDVISYEKKEK